MKMSLVMGIGGGASCLLDRPGITWKLCHFQTEIDRLSRLYSLKCRSFLVHLHAFIVLVLHIHIHAGWMKYYANEVPIRPSDSLIKTYQTVNSLLRMT